MTIRQQIHRWLNNGKPEKRAYTDLLTQAILSRATGADSIYSGALEIAAGTVSRAFASAGPAARYFTATVLGEIGRDLIEVGESVWGIGADSLRHLPAMDVDSPGRTLHLRYSTAVYSGRGIGAAWASQYPRQFGQYAGILVGERKRHIMSVYRL